MAYSGTPTGCDRENGNEGQPRRGRTGILTNVDQAFQPDGRQAGKPDLRSATTRRGFTLVEVLVVLLIILLITSITLPVVLGAMEGRKIREGARLLDIYLNGAKNRAMQTGRSVGVVFETQLLSPLLAGGVATSGSYSTGDAGYVTTLGYADVPPSYTGDYALSTATMNGHGMIAFLGANSTAQDTGWVGLVRPGDLIRFSGHSELYRLYAGEPWYDVNANGVFDNTIDLYLDSNGDGIFEGNAGYLTPDGYFNVPPLATAPVWTFTYADPGRALQTMWPAWSTTTPWVAFNGAGGTVPYVPQILSPSAVSYEILRSPVPMASGKITLPDGVCVDMGGSLGSYTDSAGRPICLPGSGYDYPYLENGNTLTAYTGFRANWQIDPIFNSGQATNIAAAYGADPLPYSRNVIVTFNPTGTVDLVYSWDDPVFTPIVGWQGHYPIGPIYFLVARTELVGGDPELLGPLLNGVTPTAPVFNFQDPNNLWVAVNPQTGIVATGQNAAVPFDNLAFYLWTPGQAPSFATLQVYLSAQLWQSRQLARTMASMGGR